MSSRHTLHYANPLPLLKRRSFRRGVGIGVILLLGVGCAIWGPTVGRWTQVMYWQHRALNCTLPPDRAILTCDLANPSTTVLDSSMTNLNNHFGENQTGNLAPIAFLHRMQRPDGQARLVSVGIHFGGWYSQSASIDFVGESWIPGTLNKMPRFTSSNWNSLPMTDAVGAVRVLAGQIDPQNSTHFTLPCELNAKQFIVDGWLDNNDHLLIAARP